METKQGHDGAVNFAYSLVGVVSFAYFLVGVVSLVSVVNFAYSLVGVVSLVRVVNFAYSLIGDISLFRVISFAYYLVRVVSFVGLKNILISCPLFCSRHVSGRVWNTKACIVIVECWGFFLAPHFMSNLTGGLLLKLIVIGGLLLDTIIFGGSFVTLVTWFNDFYLSQLSLEDCLDHLSPCK